MYYVRPRLPDQWELTTSDGTNRLRVERVGNIDEVFHGRSDEPITLCNVSCVLDLIFNFFSFHKAQQAHVIILDAAGAYIAGENFTFPCEKSGSYLRVSACTQFCRGETKNKSSNSKSDFCPLSSCVPSCPPSVPNSSWFSGASKVSGTDAAYDDWLEPISSPPVSSVLGEIESGGNLFLRRIVLWRRPP